MSSPDLVLVVGAGPVGLALALALARFEVPTLVVDAEEGASCEGSRSICIQNQTLEALARAGGGERIGAEGVSWTVGRTYFRTSELFQTRLAAQGSEHFPPFVNIPQSRVEEILLDEAQASPHIDFLWRHQAREVRQDAGGVTLLADGPGGERELAAPYAAGCDGARSAVRRSLGLGFAGHSFHDRFLIADIRADLPFPDERRFFFDPPSNPGRQVLVHPQPDRVWRIDWQVPPHVDHERERASGRLHERIRAIVGDAGYEIAWVSTYTFHQRMAERMQVGRVFLAGDAAHLMSPFGARGLNSGVADADNLAWKLALVLRGQAPAALLDTYDLERRPAAVENLAVTGRTMRFMVPASPARRLLRNAVLRGSLRVPALRRFVDSGKLARPFVYAGSPVVVPAPPGRRNGPVPGSVAPDAPCRLAGDPAVRRLRDLPGTAFTALWFAPGQAAARAAAERATAAPAPAPVGFYPVLPPEGPAGEAPGDLPLLLDDQGALQRAYAASPGLLCLIRPDGHLAACQPGSSGVELPALVATATGA